MTLSARRRRQNMPEATVRASTDRRPPSGPSGPPWAYSPCTATLAVPGVHLSIERRPDSAPRVTRAAPERLALAAGRQRRVGPMRAPSGRAAVGPMAVGRSRSVGSRPRPGGRPARRRTTGRIRTSYDAAAMLMAHLDTTAWTAQFGEAASRCAAGRGELGEPGRHEFISPDAGGLSRYPTRTGRVACDVIGGTLDGCIPNQISTIKTPCDRTWVKADPVGAT